MKYVIGCLAIIGVIAILVIGGCIGLLGYGIASLPKIPDYVNRNEIENKYSSDLKIIEKCIKENSESKIKRMVSPDIYAVYKNDKDILSRYKIERKSYHISNGIGIGKLNNGIKDADCIIYEIKIDEIDYQIFIFDRKAMPNQSLKGKM